MQVGELRCQCFSGLNERGDDAARRRHVDAPRQVLQRLAAIAEEAQLGAGDLELLADIGEGALGLEGHEIDGLPQAQPGLDADDHEIDAIGQRVVEAPAPSGARPR